MHLHNNVYRLQCVCKEFNIMVFVSADALLLENYNIPNYYYLLNSVRLYYHCMLDHFK